MKKENPERDERIENEILVDCYDEYEQRYAWESYLSDNISFPFTAKTKFKNKKGEEILVDVEVLHFDKKNSFRVEVTEKNSELLFSISLLMLKEVKAGFDTKQAINDWKYWKKR